jgi:protein FrlC
MKHIKKNQIAVMNIQYKYFPLTAFLDDAVKNNVDNIELWGAAPHFYLDDMTYREVTAVRREIEKRKLKLVCYTGTMCVSNQYRVFLQRDATQKRKVFRR